MTHFLSEIALIGAALGCIVFVITYHVLADWRHTPIGRNVMAFMTIAAILLSVGFAREFIPWFDDHRDTVRLLAYSSVAFIVWWRVILLVQEQRANTREEQTHANR